MSIPVTSKIRQRPVWRRHRLRVLSNINPIAPPTEEEKADAIRVLEDEDNQLIPGLWDEAHRILDEAGQ